MPVVRGPVKGPSVAAEARKSMLEKLENELAGKPHAKGKTMWEVPLIFEIPLERLDGTSDRIDVLVVWNEFGIMRPQERSVLILEAYGDRADVVSQATGVNHDEMMEQGLLPYRMMHMERPDDADPAEINQAMLDEGGFLIGDRAELLLPTRKMAEAAAARLNERVPKGRWAVGELMH
jgi:hypothetical protein